MENPYVTSSSKEHRQVNISKTVRKQWGEMKATQSENNDYYTEMAKQVAMSNSEEDEGEISRYNKMKPERIIVHKEVTKTRTVETIKQTIDQQQRLKCGYGEETPKSGNFSKKFWQDGSHYEERREGKD